MGRARKGENLVTLCGARTRQTGQPCSRPAGWGTDHAGLGKCKLHGGASSGRPPIHGRYSLAHRRSLQAKVERFLLDPTPGDLTGELALTRALLQDYLDRFASEDVRMTAEDIAVIQSLIQDARRLVEAIVKIYERTTLSPGEVAYLQSR